jgi:murein DD-endopeptidase MepM/ murein hydrolase activator NlpD
MRYEGRVSWRTAFLTIATLELAALIALGAWMAVSHQALVLAFEPRVVAEAHDADDALLLVPVAGVRRQELRDSFGAPRSGGRQHLGTDILAPEGTAVLAAADGVVVKRDNSALGGTSLYVRGSDGVTIYYYAHLSGYRAGLKEGDLVRRGEPIAMVGHTGNAPVPHLHFGVYTVADPNRWWHGHDLDPYKLLTAPR